MALKRGFSLLELIVAIGVFSVVATMATGSLFILFKAQQKAVNVQAVQDNIRFGLETMAREIRTGVEFQNCPGDTSCFQFIKGPNQPSEPIITVTYMKATHDPDNRLNNPIAINNPTASTYCGEPAGTVISCIAKKTDDGSGTAFFFPVTAREVSISRLNFHLTGEVSNDGYQPRLTIAVQAQAPFVFSTVPAVLNLQTTISQFVADIE